MSLLRTANDPEHAIQYRVMLLVSVVLAQSLGKARLGGDLRLARM